MFEYVANTLANHGLPNSVISEVTQLFSPMHISSGTITLYPGQRWNELMIIRQGIFRVYYLNSEGKESNKGFFKEGQIIGPVARCAIERPALFYAETLTDVQAYRCQYDDLSATLGQHPEGGKLFSYLSEKLLEDKIRRELMFLQLDASGRYEQFKKDFPSLHERIPLRHIASYLGMTDVTLSRIRAAKNSVIKC